MAYSYNEANKIISDTQHPLHQRYYSNDKEVIAGVEDAFRAEHPGDTDLSGGLPAHIEQAMAKDLNVKSESEPYPLKPPGKVIGRIGPAPPEPQATPPADGTPVEFSPEWDFDQQQGDAALRQHLGPYRYVEAMADLQDPQNFALVFDRFIQTPEDGRFLRELFQTVGNHPTGYRLYHHFIKLAKGEL